MATSHAKPLTCELLRLLNFGHSIQIDLGDDTCDYPLFCPLRDAIHRAFVASSLASVVVAGANQRLPLKFAESDVRVIVMMAGSRVIELCLHECETIALQVGDVLFVPPRASISSEPETDIAMALTLALRFPLIHSQTMQIFPLWMLGCTCSSVCDNISCAWPATSALALAAIDLVAVGWTVTVHDNAVHVVLEPSRTNKQEPPPQTSPLSSVSNHTQPTTCHIGQTCQSLGLSGQLVQASSCGCDANCGCDEECVGCCGCDGLFHMHDCGCDCWGLCQRACDCDSSCECDDCQGCYEAESLQCGATVAHQLERDTTGKGSHIFTLVLDHPSFVEIISCFHNASISVTMVLTSVDLSVTETVGHFESGAVDNTWCANRYRLSGHVHAGTHSLTLRVAAVQFATAPLVVPYSVAWASCSPNECATSNGGCDTLVVCRDTERSFACGECPVGYVSRELPDASAVNALVVTSNATAVSRVQCWSVSELLVFTNFTMLQISTLSRHRVDFTQPIFLFHRISALSLPLFGVSNAAFTMLPVRVWVQDMTRNDTVSMALSSVKLTLHSQTALGVKFSLTLPASVLAHGLRCEGTCVLGVESRIDTLDTSSPTHKQLLSLTIAVVPVELPFAGIEYPESLINEVLALSIAGVVLMLFLGTIFVVRRSSRQTPSLSAYPHYAMPTSHPPLSHQRLVEQDHSSADISMVVMGSNSNHNYGFCNHSAGVVSVPPVVPVFALHHEDTLPAKRDPRLEATTSERGLCQICQDRSINSTFPCGHTLCVQCANSILSSPPSLCHMCREPVHSLIQIFI
eukprot:c12270_g1_i1.p1 GENE.c12270_g1_i1~~c12270_g1_i1.p1  ORF type:complete len:897 (-),score=182.24 c12270_g1_i1:191-2602(-)